MKRLDQTIAAVIIKKLLTSIGLQNWNFLMKYAKTSPIKQITSNLMTPMNCSGHLISFNLLPQYDMIIKLWLIKMEISNDSLI